jgi:phosphatidylserine/phosphatidylglycerophosphate/cardiolipin synthase-like enzyme
MAGAPAPVGRPAKLNVQILQDAEFWQRMRQEVNAASYVMLAALMFDEDSLQNLFLRRLHDRYQFALDVLVDEEAYDARTARSQRPHLLALRRAGARVFLCSGSPPPRGRGFSGSFHMKVLAIDQKVVYTGSANFTNKSHRNTELHLRIMGPPVAPIVRMAESARSIGRLLKADD